MQEAIWVEITISLKMCPSHPNNGAILNLAKIVKAVMSSVAEAELGALYIIARKGVEIRNILEEIGHLNPRTSANGQLNSRWDNQLTCPTQAHKN